MLSNTQVVAGIRNIGKAEDGGQFFDGSVRDSLLWLATQLGGITMAKRVQISIARNMEDCKTGLTTKRASGTHVTGSNEFNSLLDQAFAMRAAEGAETDLDSLRDPEDDYGRVIQTKA